MAVGPPGMKGGPPGVAADPLGMALGHGLILPLPEM